MKRLFSTLLLSAAALSLSFSALALSAQDFSDYPEITHREAVEGCVNMGIIHGFPDGSFRPFEPLTRGQMCKLIAIAANGGEEPYTSVRGTPAFHDIQGNWAEPFIEYCAERGIVSGMGDGSFQPEGQVTGLQAAKMLLVSMLGADPAPFNGAAWAESVSEAADQAGLFLELDSLYRPDSIDREDTAQMIMNAYQAAGGIPTPPGIAPRGDKVRFFVRDWDAPPLAIHEAPNGSSPLVGEFSSSFIDFLLYFGTSAEGPDYDGENYTWYYIRTSGPELTGVTEGWVRSDLLTEASPIDVYASDQHPTHFKDLDGPLVLYSEPDFSSEPVCTVTENGTDLYFLYRCLWNPEYDEWSPEWIQVSAGGDLDRIGWVLSDLVGEGEIGSQRIPLVKDTPDPLNVRSEPRHDSDLVTTVQSDDTVLYWRGILAENTAEGYGSDGLLHEWYRVFLNTTQYGWVRSDLVRINYDPNDPDLW